MRRIWLGAFLEICERAQDLVWCTLEICERARGLVCCTLFVSVHSFWFGELWICSSVRGNWFWCTFLRLLDVRGFGLVHF